MGEVVRIREGEGWIILRCGGPRTLTLATSLAEDGFDVWTPARKETIRRKRWYKAKRIDRPLVPGFLFARQRHLQELLDMAKLDIKPRRGAGLLKAAHAAFTVLRDPLIDDGFPVVADSALVELREREKPAKVKRRAHIYGNGDELKITEGCYEGMNAVFDRGDRRSSTVWISLFGRFQRLKLPTSILRLTEVNEFRPATDRAAKRAA